VINTAAQGQRTLVVWCPDWPVTAAGVNPDMAAVVVSANRVVACSQVARAHGVRSGLRRREAQARCPDLAVLGRDISQEARAFEPVAAAVEVFTPRVEVIRPGQCALATRGPSRYFGGDEALAAQVAVAVARAVAVVGAVGVAAGAPDGTAPAGGAPLVGVADGPFAAGLAARQGIVVAPGGSAEFLAPLPVSALGRPELADLLRRLGIRTLGQLAALPGPDVAARFGADGTAAHRLAQGRDDRHLAPRVPPPDLAAVVSFDPPVERVDTAAFAARALAEDLHQRLGRLGLSCCRVRVEAETEHGESLIRLWRNDGSFTAGALAERVRWQLDGWLRAGEGSTVGERPAGERPTAGLTRLSLVPDEVVPDGASQPGFWGESADIDERIGRALARIQGLLGPEAVVTAAVSGGRGPADQVLLVPWGDLRPADRPAPAAGPQPRPALSAPAAGWPPWPGRIPPPAPAVVHPEPLPAELVDPDGQAVAVTGRGTLGSRPPRRLSVAGGAWSEVVAWGGPWPVDERWWDPLAHHRRARLQVATADGAVHLLALEAGRWSVEATYD